MTRIERLLHGDGIIYVAGRLFDIDDKLKSEDLEDAVLAGVDDAASHRGLHVGRRTTFVPFRDAGQEELAVADKTRLLFELDLVRLGRATLLVSYVDGLAKDEGVCFEIGYAYAAGAAIVLISTDFFDLELPNGHEAPLDPLLCAAATRLIRHPRLTGTGRTFRDVLLETRAHVMQEVRVAVRETLTAPESQQPRLGPGTAETGQQKVLLDFGGTVYEWQELLQDALERMVQPKAGLMLVRSRRYDATAPRTPKQAAAPDLTALVRARLLVSCTDADEAPAGTAFLQGAMCALRRPIWMYNSKRTAIRAAGDYRSSRNLMLDYSATRVFRSLKDLAGALREL